MEKTNVPLIVDFKIENPAHQMFKKGVLSFVFDEKTPTVLNRINFNIDGEKFYLNLLRVRGRYNTTWLFQKEGSLKSVPREELCKILQLAKDVNEATSFRQPYKNLLNALPCQAKIYLQIMDKTTTKDQKVELMKELSKKNNLLANIVIARGHELKMQGVKPLQISSVKNQEK